MGAGEKTYPPTKFWTLYFVYAEVLYFMAIGNFTFGFEYSGFWA